MNREEERNQIAHQIAWEYTKHYDPLLSKECWCEIAVRDAIDWADAHPRKGLMDIEKACEWLNEHTVLSEKWIIEDFCKAMEK